MSCDRLIASPFYLVWLMPSKAGISPEQWPYRIISILAAPALEKHFPALLAKTSTTSPEQRGLRVFVANCSSCHKLLLRPDEVASELPSPISLEALLDFILHRAESINGAFDATVGLDLNDPYNPTENFQEPFLRKLIRAPASVRDWGQRIMPGFSPSPLKEAQLDDLLAYLRQMARQRRAKP